LPQPEHAAWFEGSLGTTILYSGTLTLAGHGIHINTNVHDKCHDITQPRR